MVCIQANGRVSIAEEADRTRGKFYTNLEHQLSYSDDEAETGQGKVAEATTKPDQRHSEDMLSDLPTRPEVAALNTEENELSVKQRSAVLQAEQDGATDQQGHKEGRLATATKHLVLNRSTTWAATVGFVLGVGVVVGSTVWRQNSGGF